jgi:hypothetical protein
MAHLDDSKGLLKSSRVPIAITLPARNLAGQSL